MLHLYKLNNIKHIYLLLAVKDIEEYTTLSITVIKPSMRFSFYLAILGNFVYMSHSVLLL